MIAPAIISGLIAAVPSLAKMIGMSDNATKVAEIAVDVAKSITGIPDDKDAIAALQNSPDLMLQFQLAMVEKEKQYEEMYVTDKHSARARDMEFIKIGKPNVRANFLICFVSIVLVIILVVVTWVDLNEYAKGMFTMLAGFITNQLSNVFSFEFGTTRKEEENNKSIIQDYIKSPGNPRT